MRPLFRLRIASVYTSSVCLTLCGIVLSACVGTHKTEDIRKPSQTRQQVIESSTDRDWRSPKPENTLYLELAHGRIIFELAPSFAPAHLDNLKQLLLQNYFDGLAIVRVQDNYVAQWGDPAATTKQARSLGRARIELDGEYFRPAEGLAFSPLSSRDAYADEVGFVDGFPVGQGYIPPTPTQNPTKNAWLLHCYGALGVGRDVDSRSGNAAELYAVIGHSPRHLDRNVTLIGRALTGIEHLSALPRGTGTLGFYEPAASGPTIKRMYLASDLPAAQRDTIRILRTDTTTFQAWVAASTYRREEWFIDPARRIEICNVPIPTRIIPAR